MGFCALLDHPLCTFRPYVRTLKLREPYRCPSELMKRQWLRTVLPQLATLPNVEYLHLKDMWFYQVSATDWADIVLPLFGPHLKRLSIFSTYFTRPSDVVELVSRCTQLEVLKLASLTMTMDRCSRQDVVIYPRPSRELRQVSFHGEEALNVIHWLASTTTCTPPPLLSIMSFEDMTPSYCILVARCLDVFGSSITSLTLGFSEDGTYTYAEDLFCKHANPSSLTHLRTIRFGPLGIMAWAPDTAAACHIARILSEIGSTDVREISFGAICCLSVNDMSLMDWDAIISILNRTTYSRLEALRLIFWEEQAELCKETEVWLQYVRES
ncbi:hypothetical protein BDZ89DRAFT_445294 [Hymenopellis radicata]|nr:hypothetical protein BDZ89DRAFT_445294 [Hymenopellis radicata]